MKRPLLGLFILGSALFTAAPVLAGVTCSLTCPNNVTQNNDTNQCGAVVNYPPASATNCGQTHPNPPPGSFFPVGTTTVTVDTDATTSCQFTVTVKDIEVPTITCPADVDQFAASPTAVSFTAPTVSDNCPNATATCDPVSGSTFPIGQTLDTCTATDTANNTATCNFNVTLTVPADLSVTKTDLPDPVAAGSNLTYSIVLTDNGPDDASNISLTDVVPPNTTFVTFTSPGGWTNTIPAPGGTGTITSTNVGLINGGSATFLLVVKVDNGVPDGTVLTNTVAVTASTPDNDMSNNTKTVTTSVGLAQITIDDVSVTEGNSGTVDACFTVSLSKPSTSIVTVDAATADGTATAPDDYLSNAGTVNFPPGQTSEPFCVTVNSDLLPESNETFFVNLTNPISATISDDQGVGTIIDDDGPPQPSANNDNIEGSGCLLAKGANGTTAFSLVSLLLAVGILAARRKSSYPEK